VEANASAFVFLGGAYVFLWLTFVEISVKIWAIVAPRQGVAKNRK
jgi:hypothetical protein